MKYFGIPTCPYCKKRVNLIRVWSLKKHGEFRCPRCKGISNIYLSPLVYLFAFMAVAAGFLIYFFAKFISDNVTLMTVVKVFLPFAAFFLVSLFLVYLEKPVIKRVKKTADGRYFDEDGNELKMRMGKLVKKSDSAASTAKNAETENSRIVNSYDMLGDEVEVKIPVTARTAAGSAAGRMPLQQKSTAETSADNKVNLSGSAANKSDNTAASARIPVNTAAPAEKEPLVQDDIMNYVPGDESVKFYTNSDFPDDEALYAAAAKITGNNTVDFDNTDTAAVSPKAASPKRSKAPAAMDEPIKAGKVASERDKGRDTVPNSGFEDLFDSYRNTDARKNEGNRERRFRDL